MTKFRNIAKGVSFLLCLGFLVFVDNALAKGIGDITGEDVYARCPNASAQVSKYNTLKECSAEKTAVQSAQSALDSVCNMYKSIKKEYKKCTSGEMSKSKEAVAKLESAKKTFSSCESKMDDYLDAAKDAIKACEKAEKDAKKAEEKAAKAKEKEDKAKEKADEAAQANTDMLIALDEYTYAESQCEGGNTSACAQMENLYEAYEKAAKKAGKTANKALSAQKKANNAQSKADAAEEKAGASKSAAMCDNGETWDGSQCVSTGLNVNAGALASTAGDTGGGVSQTGGVTSTSSDNSNASMQSDINEAKAQATDDVKKCDVDRTGFGIFNYLACRITVLVADLRAIVYVLAGFGMIAFAYGAIIGKINFKQLAYMGIGLFILSMTTSFIEYFVFNDGVSRLQFGSTYLEDGNHAQYFTVHKDCSNDKSLCPDAQLAGLKDSAEKSKGSFSLKDLKNSIKSVKDAIKTTANTVATVKAAVSTAKNAVKNISDAIRGTSDGVRTAEASLKTAKNQLNEAKAAKAEKDAALDAAMAERDAQQEKVNAVNKKVADAEAEVKEANEAIEKTKDEMATLRNALNRNNLANNIANIDNEIKRLEESKAKLDPSRKDQADKIRQIEAQIAAKKQRAEELSGELENLNQIYAQYGSDEAINSRLRTLEDDLSENRFILTEKQKAVNEAKQELRQEEAALKQEDAKVKQAENAVQSAQNVVDAHERAVATAEANLDYAKDNAGDFLTNVGKIASNASTLLATTNMAANTVVRGATSVSGNLQSAGMTEEQRAYQAALNQEYNNLKAKCDLGNCSQNEIDALNNMQDDVQASKTKTQKWAENDGKGGGSTILDGLAQAAATAQKAKDVTQKVAGAKGEGEHLGNQLGGGTLGNILGATYAATEALTSGSDALDDAKKDGLFDYRSDQKKAADAEAEAKAQCAQDGWNWVDGKCVDPNAKQKAEAAAKKAAEEKAAAEAKAKAEQNAKIECSNKYSGLMEGGSCQKCAALAPRGSYTWAKDKDGKEKCLKK